MHLLRLLHFLGGNILDGGFAAIGSPRELLHQDNVDEGVEVCAGLHGVLHGHNLCAVVGREVFENFIVVAVVAVELVHEEDNGLGEFLRIAEVVLRANFRTELAIDEQHGGIGDVQRGHGCAHEVVRTRAVDDVEFLAHPFNVEDGREYGVAIILFYGEVVGNGVLCSNSAAALNQSAFKEKCFRKGGFT